MGFQLNFDKVMPDVHSIFFLRVFNDTLQSGELPESIRKAIVKLPKKRSFKSCVLLELFYFSLTTTDSILT